MPKPERQQSVLDLLKGLRGIEPLKQLFWSELNYQRVNQPLSRRGWTESASTALADDPVLFAGGGEDNAFHVIYCRLASDALARGFERPVVTRLLRQHPYALFVFSNKGQTDWHFLNVKFDETPEKRRLFRRITIGPGEGLRTPTERLSMLDLASLGQDLFGISALEIQRRHDDAFDVEKVTREFYEEVSNWHFWARDHATFPKDAPVDSDGKPSLPLIRLLTRLVFCWFLRQKRNPQTDEGLIPDTLFVPSGIGQLLKDASPDSCTYYPAILQNLFFATLNTEMDVPGQKPNRRFIDEGDGQRSDDHMVHTFWRHDKLLRDPEALAHLLRTVPFLNGGLFECLDDRVQKGNSSFTTEIRIDGFSNDRAKQPKLPNFLFFGPDQTVDLSGAYGDSSRRRERVRPLLSILQRYNFTLAENTPLEQEVALDPELLGHVFENLLAAYNPETGMVARKATGSFYTPRVVVDWMVDQALLVNLNSALVRPDNAPAPDKRNERLQRLLSWEDSGHDFRPQEIEALIDAIDHLKALDPACGSGAFPMGLLQKLVHVLRKLDPENKGWRRRQEKALDTFESAPARDEARLAIERAFARDNDDYGRKLYLIENCLYGVDIQPIACQIAKLRFFISLVVDQHIDPKQPNYAILPLPNLETKIVAADTLLGLQRGQLLLGSDSVRSLEKQLQQVRHDYFTARRYKDKKALRARDKELSGQLAAALTESGECSAYDASRLAEWNPYDTNKEAPFFDPAWMFGLPVPGTRDKGVFDLVIGNPPYVRQEQLKNVTAIGSNGKPRPLKDALKDLYECYTGTADLYVYFFERALQLLRVGGVLSFITSNKYMRAAYGERLRTYLFYATHPHVILDFGDADLFTSIAYPCICVTQKIRQIDKGGLPDPAQFALPDRIRQLLDAPDRKLRVHTWQPGTALNDFPEVFAQQANDLVQRDLNPASWKFEAPGMQKLRRRLEMAGVPLGRFASELVFNGIKSGHKNAFTLTHEQRDWLIQHEPAAKEVIEPLLKGRDIKRWRVETTSRWLLYIPWHFPFGDSSGVDPASTAAEKAFRQRLPRTFSHISQFRKELGERDQSEVGIRYEWFCLSRPRPEAAEFFQRPKIVFPDIAVEPCFAWDDQGHAIENTAYMIPGHKWLLGVLNSSPIFWFCRQISNTIRGGFVRFIRQYVEKIPVPDADQKQRFLCERLVDSLLWLRRPGGSRGTAEPAASLMISYFEQWLNGLVYELFFPEDLHARRLKLFDETAKLNPPDLADLPDSSKIQALGELFDKAYAPNAPLRGSLLDLGSLEVVRIIEETSNQAATPVIAEAE